MADPTPAPSFLASLHLDDPGSLRRLLTSVLGGVITMALPVLNANLGKVGIPALDTPTIIGMMVTVGGIVASYVKQSGEKAGAKLIADAHVAGAVAAAAVTTPEQAAAVLADPVKP